MGDQINFTKRANPQNIAFNQSTLITYSLYNLTNLPIISAIIEDTLLALPHLVITAYHNCTINFTNSTIHLGLPKEGLKKNANTSCMIQVYSTDHTPPSDELYATNATVTTIVSTTPPTLLTETAKTKLTINGAHIIVSNSISPTEVVSPGETVMYTIELKNTGNRPATIHPGEFHNYWHPYRLTNIIVSDNHLLATENEIINTSTIHISDGSSFLFTVSATIY